MTLTIEYHETDLFELATKALRARRLFQEAAQASRDAMSATARTMLDDHLVALSDTLFAAPVLSGGDALLACLHDDVAHAGGAPTRFYTDEGDAYTEGGTGDGRRIEAAADHLAACLTLAWRVNDVLTAEASIAQQRKALAAVPKGSPPDPSPDSKC